MNEIIKATEWKKKNTVTKDITRSSGVTLKIKKIGVFDLALAGHIPANFLSNIMGVDKKKNDISSFLKSDQDIKVLGTMIEEIAIAAVIEPKVSRENDSDDKNVMLVTDIPSEDLMEIFSEVMSFGNTVTKGEEKSLTTFPKKR